MQGQMNASRTLHLTKYKFVYYLIKFYTKATAMTSRKSLGINLPLKLSSIFRNKPERPVSCGKNT